MRSYVKRGLFWGAGLLVTVLALIAVAVWPGGPERSLALTNCTPPAGETNHGAQETALLTLINNHRAANGRRPLQFEFDLDRSAAWMLNDMAANGYFPDSFGPASTPGSSLTDRIERTFSTRLNQCDYLAPSR